MIYLSEATIEALKADSTPKNYRIHFPNGERADITNENIISESCCFTESTCSSEFELGVCENPVFEFETVGVENIKGKKIEVSLEVLDESISIGVFYVDECQRQADMTHRKITAYGINTFKDEESTWKPYYLAVPDEVPYNYNPISRALTFVHSQITDKEEMGEELGISLNMTTNFPTAFVFNPFYDQYGQVEYHDVITVAALNCPRQVPSVNWDSFFVDPNKDRYDMVIQRCIENVKSQFSGFPQATGDMVDAVINFIKTFPPMSIGYVVSGAEYIQQPACPIHDTGYAHTMKNGEYGGAHSGYVQDLLGYQLFWRRDSNVLINNEIFTVVSGLNLNKCLPVYLPAFTEILDSDTFAAAHYHSEGAWGPFDIDCYREITGIDADKAQDLISAWAELKGKLGRVDRSGRFRLVPPIVSQTRVPLDTLYPSDNLYPDYDKARILPDDFLYPSNVLYPEDNATCLDLLPGDYSSFWYDDFYDKPFGKVECNYTDYDTHEKAYYSLNIAEDYDQNVSSYRVYDLSKNMIISDYEVKQSSVIWACDNIKASLGGLSYIPVSIEANGRPDIEAGDAIRVNGYDTVVLRRTLKGIQSLRDSYEAE